MFGYLQEIDARLYERYLTLVRNIQAGSNSFYDAYLSLLEQFLKLALKNAAIQCGDHETCGEMLRRAEVKAYFEQALKVEEATYGKLQDYVRKINQHKHRGEKHVEPDTIVSYMRVFYDVTVAYALQQGVVVLLPFSQEYILSTFNALVYQNAALKNEQQRISAMAYRIDTMSAQMQQLTQNVNAMVTKQSQVQVATPYIPQEPPHLVIARFVKRAIKEYRWFGDANAFSTARANALLWGYLSILLLVASSILVTYLCGFYTTYTFFENIWLLLLICTITYLHKAMRFYDCDKFSKYSFHHFKRNANGVWCMGHIKARYIVFFVFYCISVIGNLAMLWGTSLWLGLLAAFVEILGFAFGVYAFFIKSCNFFSGYLFVQLTGPNDFFTETIVLVCDPVLDTYFDLAQFEERFPFAK